MSRLDKLLEKLKSKPKDFTYDELSRLLANVGCIEDSTGKTAGSRVAFIHQQTKLVLRLHRPHPGNELKVYQVELVIKFLDTIGVR